MNKTLKNRLFQIRYSNRIETIIYWSTCILGGVIGAVMVFAIFDLLLMLQNKI